MAATATTSSTTGRAPSITRVQTLASGLTVLLAAIASAVGLFVPHFYRDPDVLVVQAYGQDLLTLAVAVPALAISLSVARRGSLRAYIVWLGVTAYVCYTYLTYSLMTTFNELYLVYTTLLWLTLYTFVSGIVHLDADRLAATVDDLDVRPYIAFEALLALLVGALWLSEIVPAMLAGTTPPSTVEAGLPVNVIQSLDLGVILPAFLLTAYWLSRRRAWGYALTAILLAKGVTLGGAILAMILMMQLAGQSAPLPQVVIFGAITLAALALLVRFLLAMGGESTTNASTTAAPPTPGSE